MAKTHISAREGALKVLREADGPLPAKELAERTLAVPGVELKGKTPEATIAAMLATSNKNGGPFVRTAKGVYGLRPEAEGAEMTADLAPSKDEAKPDPKPASKKRRAKATA